MARETTDPAKHTFSSFIVARDEVPQLEVAASSGDPHARALVRVISKWLEMARALPHEQAPRCMNCDVTFHQENLAAAVAVVLPFAPGQGQSAAALGICAECVDQAGSNLSDVPSTTGASCGLTCRCCPQDTADAYTPVDAPLYWSLSGLIVRSVDHRRRGKCQQTSSSCGRRIQA